MSYTTLGFAAFAKSHAQGYKLKILIQINLQKYTSSTARGGGGSFKNRKPIIRRDSLLRVTDGRAKTLMMLSRCCKDIRAKRCHIKVPVSDRVEDRKIKPQRSKVNYKWTTEKSDHWKLLRTTDGGQQSYTKVTSTVGLEDDRWRTEKSHLMARHQAE